MHNTWCTIHNILIVFLVLKTFYSKRINYPQITRIITNYIYIKIFVNICDICGQILFIHIIIIETNDFGRYFAEPTWLCVDTCLHFDEVDILEIYEIALRVDGICPIYQMRTWRLRETNSCAPGHTTPSTLGLHLVLTDCKAPVLHRLHHSSSQGRDSQRCCADRYSFPAKSCWCLLFLWHCSQCWNV